jgi:hypothetical protein
MNGTDRAVRTADNPPLERTGGKMICEGRRSCRRPLNGHYGYLPKALVHQAELKAIGHRPGIPREP